MNSKVTTGNSRHSGYERSANDWYVEPPWAVEALLDVEKFDGITYDPACGGGTIPKVFRDRNLQCEGSDLVDRGFGFKKADYLDPLMNPHSENIVTNPPFNLAEQFVLKALQRNNKVAILQRLAWLESAKRRMFFESTPLARVWVFARRVSMPPGGTDINQKGGSIPFAWFVWDYCHKGPPILGWLP